MEHVNVKQQWEGNDYGNSKTSEDEGLQFNDLKHSLREKDSQLNLVRSKNENILRQYKESQEELEQCHEQIARQASIIHEQSYKLEESKRRISEISQTHNNLLQKNQINSNSFQNEIEQNSEEMRRIAEQLTFRDEKIKILYEALDQEKEKVKELSDDVEFKDEENSTLRYK